MKWFTADLHFNHSHIIPYTDRGFSSVDEMNEVIITRWNEKVKKGDMVYVLGDFGFMRKKEETTSFLKKLKGRKILIIGNHDDRRVLGAEGWDWVGPYKKLKEEGREIILFHYPIRSWEGRGHGAIHLHGHTHNSIELAEGRMDVGVDANKMTPFSLQDIFTELDARERRYAQMVEVGK